MIFLAVDTSLQATSVAIMEIDQAGTKKVLASEYLNVNLTHSETTQALVESSLASSNLSLKDVDYFVAVTGPGSFTGLRIGVSLVKTLACTQKKPCIAVNTLSALAYETATVFKNDSHTLIVPLIDARNERVFAKIISSTEVLMETQGLAFKDLLALLERDFAKTEKKVIFVTCSNLAFFVKYKEELANLKTWQLLETELTAQKALTFLSEAYVANKCKIINYNDLQPNYYALSQAERSKTQTHA